ncbi:hypothetical protein TEA_010014 [Camellia sinensis var. sinensis]|uniref:Uncharacterized protein n=1 Tax=Camellia sinensis var. sinensis TaxID=542762 RepID=A0A4S4EZ19_CAMSN|nr:hypothetical protein TEA_010014 [Camellia sinensis var. sinensis]
MSDYKFVFLLLILSSLISSQVSFAINGKEETQEIANESNEFIHNTLFYCYMFWNGVSGSFDVFRESRDNGRCASRCWWSIRTAGAFSLDVSGSWDLMYTMFLLGSYVYHVSGSWDLMYTMFLVVGILCIPCFW